MNLGRVLVGTSLGALAAVGADAQSSTETYNYDALGRLMTAVTAGGQNNGEAHSICYDDAGNRKVYDSKSTASTIDCTSVASPTAPNYTVGNASATESGSLSFTITQGTSATIPYSVAWSTVDGTAKDGQDYSADYGTATFEPGQTAKTVSISTLDDVVLEPNEAFYLDIVGLPAGGTASTSRGTGTIIDDDNVNNAPTANVDSASVGVCGYVSINVVANDTDQDGDYPLTLISVGSSSKGQTVKLSSTTVGFTAYGTAGSTSFTYIIEDSRGARATGTVSITISSGSGCF